MTAARPQPNELFDEGFIVRVFGRGGQIVAFDLTQEKLKHLFVECEPGETAAQLAERVTAALKAR